MSKARCLRLLEFYLDEGEITPETYKNAKQWLTHAEFAPYRDEVMNLIRPMGLSDSFFQLIPFGTGGRRGTVGVGTNRINARTIAESAQGLANHILASDTGGALKKRGVVISYDVRNTSEEFSVICAEVLAAAGIQVYLFDGPRSTPELSFAIRHLKCAAGVILTASHNPPSDNGFKAYWEDGGQLVAPNDKLVLDQVKRVRKIARMPLSLAKKKKRVRIIGAAVDNAYFNKLQTLDLTPKRNTTLVFSPLHGTGMTTIPRALAQMGFKKVHMPPEQTTLDGNFPTVKDHYPNPEMPAALEVAVELGRKVNADLVMATDPDADRLGVFVPDKKGEFTYLTGNQVGAMLCHFVLDSLSRAKKMPAQPFIITTLVSTKMARAIADSFGVETFDDLLVGFKWMAQLLDRKEKQGEDLSNFLFAFEESIGFLRGSFVRDKDAAAGAVTAAQLAAVCKSKKMSLLDYLDRLYAQYGYFKEIQFSRFLHGSAGSARMDKLMQTLRTSPPETIGGLAVHAIADRQSGIRRVVSTGEAFEIPGAKGNVLVFELDKQGFTSLTVRPSGTEPKVKYYVAAFGQPGPGLAATKKKVEKLVAKLIRGAKALEQKILG